jgi:hypothetical protein
VSCLSPGIWKTPTIILPSFKQCLAYLILWLSTISVFLKQLLSCISYLEFMSSIAIKQNIFSIYMFATFTGNKVRVHLFLRKMDPLLL